MWLDDLKREVESKGPKQVAWELGVSRSTVDLVVQGKYPASTGKIERRVLSIYGNGGKVECPVKGTLSPLQCSEHWRRARTIGMKAGNPETLRLYKSCVNCHIRG